MNIKSKKVSIFEKIKYLKNHHMILQFIFKKKLKKKRPIGVTIDDINNIIRNFPRDRWYYLIKNLIYEEDINNHQCIINNDQEDNYPIINNSDTLYFDLDDLKKEKFDIEPGIPYYDIKNDGIVYCYTYLPIDTRYICDDTRKALRILNYGNIPSILGVSSDGKIITDYYIKYVPKDKYHYNYEISYHNYKRIDYTPKEGEILFYIRKVVCDYLVQNNYEKYKEFINYCISNRFEYTKSYKEEIEKILE